MIILSLQQVDQVMEKKEQSKNKETSLILFTSIYEMSMKGSVYEWTMSTGAQWVIWQRIVTKFVLIVFL